MRSDAHIKEVTAITNAVAGTSITPEQARAILEPEGPQMSRESTTETLEPTHVRERRLGIFAITQETILAWVWANTDFETRYPGAEIRGVQFDFHSGDFVVKFSHPSLPEHRDGETIQRVYPNA